MIKTTLSALVLLGAAASAQADVLLQENFNNVDALGASGWVFNNASSPVGSNSWFQGNSKVFHAQSGAANSYAAASFGSAAEGGVLNNWLITPEFSTAKNVSISLWVRGANEAGFSDHISFGLSKGGSAANDFVLQPSFEAAGDWTKYTFNIGALGAGTVGRFAINYNGLADSSTYVGIDNLSIAAVPEPASFLMLGAGLFAIGALRRRQRG
ncbi:choice-of-anchor J family PEP-CTERM protein [Pseudoduganella violacea]|uniref:PEP-CTERM sorting domain-containing protein n=1 Tax=Pseudoduganella violacea TaxID=1715466 RepID=A0A7W5B6N3_9BURK|nr:choice-of-anchor J domain-containing protein [Pseudoduganella violacea]MBB3117416.1 hypothetical protein [Pseudoduganella violacea]